MSFALCVVYVSASGLHEQWVSARGLLLGEAMAPKQPLPADDQRWLDSVAGRLDRVRLDMARAAYPHLPVPPPAPSEGPSTPGVEPSATPVPVPGALQHPPRVLARPIAARSGGGASLGDPLQDGVQPRGQPSTPMEELAALRFSRAAPVAFNVQRHAVMIAGRPVVVTVLISAFWPVVC